MLKLWSLTECQRGYTLRVLLYITTISLQTALGSAFFSQENVACGHIAPSADSSRVFQDDDAGMAYPLSDDFGWLNPFSDMIWLQYL